MNPCNPPRMVAVADDPCAMLPTLRSALYSLMSGQNRVQVRNGERWMVWGAGNVKELRAEIRKLEVVCGNPPGQGRAVRVGPGQPFGYPYPVGFCRGG